MEPTGLEASGFAFPIQIAETFRLMAFDLKEVVATRLATIESEIVERVNRAASEKAKFL
jgi:hypothetical protein